MPIEFLADTTTTSIPGSTLFERMRRVSQMPAQDERSLVTIDLTALPASDTVRFDRTDVEGKPGVIMEERGIDGVWRESWSWTAQSMDAREGMVGWLSTQGHRWERFARMLHRRGPDELTAWIFELMVVPLTAEARPPRFEPQQWATIDQYAASRFSSGARRAAAQRDRAMLEDCTCRPSGVQHSRNF